MTTNEDLRKWFKQKWVNIGKKVDGKHPECGTSGEKRGYAKCVPASKARSMSKKEKESATRRKRAAQNKKGRGGTDDIKGGGKKPIRVSTDPKENIMKTSIDSLKEFIKQEIKNTLQEKNVATDKAKWAASKAAAKKKFDVYPSAYANAWAAKNYKAKGGGWKKESVEEARGTCWVGYQQKGMKKKGDKMVPNCVKEVYDIYYEEKGKGKGYTFEFITDKSLTEAEYQGRKVKLNKPMQGDKKKFKVYVKNAKGNVVVVHFGQGGDAKGGTMRIRKDNPEARKSFRARHNCDNPGPKWKARYWSCRKW